MCRDASSLLDPMECTDTAEEQRVHSPPASLVPRIHVVLAQKLQHINPLLPACLNKEESKTYYTANRLVSGLLQLPSNTSLVIDETLLEQGQLDTPDCQIHLQPQLIPPNMEEYMNSLLSAVLPSVLNKFRIYLTLLRFLDYSISDEITKAVEDDFVEMRKNDPQSITADDLHQLLIVARPKVTLLTKKTGSALKMEEFMMPHELK
ncbi:Mini-chromosome maintenance complex-binding protein, partial [Eschrichtius robustus]|nr:Mini-chromosome maintenance complex-binding protein [Eschrichtius robustus]